MLDKPKSTDTDKHDTSSWSQRAEGLKKQQSLDSEILTSTL